MEKVPPPLFLSSWVFFVTIALKNYTPSISSFLEYIYTSKLKSAPFKYIPKVKIIYQKKAFNLIDKTTFRKNHSSSAWFVLVLSHFYPLFFPSPASCLCATGGISLHMVTLKLIWMITPTHPNPHPALGYSIASAVSQSLPSASN